MVGKTQTGTNGSVRCANRPCGSRLRADADEGLADWLRFNSNSSTGYFLEEEWLCSEACLNQHIEGGILERLARPISGRHFKPVGPRIGTFLRAKGWIDSEQLLRALARQVECGSKLGKCLLELGYLSEERLLRALSEQLKVPCVLSPISQIEGEAGSMLPKLVCTQYRIVPIEYRQNHILSLAVDIDLSEEIILAIQRILSCSVQPFFTTKGALQQLLERYILPLPDSAATLFDNSTQLRERMTKVFYEKWNDYQPKKVQLASLENMVWIRFICADKVHDHLLLT